MKISVGNIKQLYIAKFVEKLGKEGERIITEMERTNNITNRSYNLHDAYVYGVYYKGVLMKYGFVGSPMSSGDHKGWSKAGINANDGRGYAMEALSEFKSKGIGYELVVVNAIYYAQILEDGTQAPNGKKYKIVSQSLSELGVMQSELGGNIKILTYNNW